MNGVPQTAASRFLPDLAALVLSRIAPAVSLESFGDFCSRVYSGPWYDHYDLAAEVAQKVADGEERRVMVMMPPGYAKSLIFSRLLPAYCLTRFPSEWVGLAASTLPIVRPLSIDAREFYAKAGGEFRLDSKDACMWRTPKGGGMFARGFGSAILSVRYRVGIVDDPFGNEEDAARVSDQTFVYNYFTGTFYGRRNPSSIRPASICVVQQRLHEHDLIGRLVAREIEKRAANQKGEEWLILDLPALKRPKVFPMPDCVRVFPDSRPPGAPLCPALHTAEALKEEEDRDRIKFAAIMQQDPLPGKGGGVFHREWFNRVGKVQSYEEIEADTLSVTELVCSLQAVDLLPAFAIEARGWDWAATQGGGDALASVRGGATLSGPVGQLPNVFWTDATEAHVGPAAILEYVLRIARLDGPGVEQVIPAEPAAAGKFMTEQMTVALKAIGCRVTVAPQSGGKRARATPHAGAAMPSAVEADSQPSEGASPGRVHVLLRAWTARFCEQHQRFTGLDPQEEDDLVDGASTAWILLGVKKHEVVRGAVGTRRFRMRRER